jgi:hypothetical protein
LWLSARTLSLSNDLPLPNLAIDATAQRLLAKNSFLELPPDKTIFQFIDLACHFNKVPNAIIYPFNLCKKTMFFLMGLAKGH